MTILGRHLHLRQVGRDPSPEEVGKGEGVAVLQPGDPLPDLPFGKVSTQCGEAAYTFVESATELALAGTVDAICTAPLSKEALHAAGHIYPGHTELPASAIPAGRGDFLGLPHRRDMRHQDAEGAAVEG